MVSEKGSKGIEVTLKVVKMVVGARRAGLSASQTAEGFKDRKIQREAVVWRKVLLMSGVTGWNGQKGWRPWRP